MNDKLQCGIIGDFLMGQYPIPRLREIAAGYDLRPEHFTDSVMRTAYEAILAFKGEDKVLLQEELTRKVGVETCMRAIESSSVSLVDVDARMRELSNAGFVTSVRELVDENCRTYASSPQSLVMSLCTKLQDAVKGRVTSAADDGISLSDLSDPVPEEDDPDALFKQRWLCKGGAAVLVSVSGSGKSVITLQLAYAWARGQEAFGIRPLRPLRIAIFQTEDDEEELKLFRSSMRTGYAKLFGWSELELAAAEKNIRFYDTKGTTGKAFAQRLREVQSRGRFDLVVVNPLQGVTGFDISQNANLTEFLRTDLDSVIKDPELKCGLFIVHHTNKPPSSRDRVGFGRDQYAEYIGAGGAELVNWMRGMLAIVPTAEDGVYNLVAGKRGKRLGWPKLPDQKSPNPMKAIRHSDWDAERMLFWKEVASSEVPRESAADGKPSLVDDAARLAVALKQLARTLTEARAFAKDLFGRKRGELAYEEVTSKSAAYELVIRPTGISTQNVIGSVEGVENAISTLVEKHTQNELRKLAKLKQNR